jgi:Arc/MetJ-type ribon-helix-helix transcriptional regulator
MVKRYRNVSLPEELYERAEELVQSRKSGYVSVSDAVKDAVREMLRKNKMLP